MIRLPVLLIGVAVATLTLAHPADARPFTKPADDLELAFGAALQPRVSYGHDEGVMVTDRLGFGLRRARVRMSATWGIAFVEMDADLSVMAPFGLYAAVAPTDRWTIRAGYFAGAQPRGLIPTGLTVIDGVERAAIIERWAQATIGGPGRDLGIDVSYRNRYVSASLWLHSGFGGLSRVAANFHRSPSGHDATGGVDRTALAISGSVGFTPQDGLELGGHFSHNRSGGAPAALTPGVERTVSSWSAHVYWGANPGSQRLRLKAEAVGIMTSGDAVEPGGSGPGEVDTSQIGAAGTAAVGLLAHDELFVRFEVFDEDDGGDLSRYLTAGLMFSLSALDGGPFERERLTLAYSRATRGDDTDHFAVLQGQWLF